MITIHMIHTIHSQQLAATYRRVSVHHAELADVHSVLEAELLRDPPFRALADAHLVLRSRLV